MDDERFGHDGRQFILRKEKRTAEKGSTGNAARAGRGRAGVRLGPGAPYCDDRSPEHTATDYSGE